MLTIDLGVGRYVVQPPVKMGICLAIHPALMEDLAKWLPTSVASKTQVEQDSAQFKGGCRSHHKGRQHSATGVEERNLHLVHPSHDGLVETEML